MQIRVSPQDQGQRLDLFLTQQLPELSRTRVQSLIREGAVLVGDRREPVRYAVRDGDTVRVEVPEPEPLQIQPESIPLDILYEDRDLLVVDKPAGMAVHPAPGSWQGTLVNALLHHCSDLSGINGVLRPGIVHRLDKNTTGLLLVAKNDRAHRGLAAQLESRSLERRYTALVWGLPTEETGLVDAPIGRNPRDRKLMAVVAGGRAARTHFEVVERYPFLSRLDLRLETGRTHQIRVHLQHDGHPVFGDPAYGGRSRADGIRPEYRRTARGLLGLVDRQALHARRVGFDHPASGARLEFEAGPPPDMAGLIDAARQS